MFVSEKAIPGDSERMLAPERRNDHDRRRHSWRTVTYCGFRGRGRRRHARRQGQNYYVDWYDPKLVLTGLTVLLLSCLDAMFTLTLLGKGAYEANYFMAQLLHVSTELFVGVKVALTSVGVIFLLMHSHFRVLRFTNGRRLLQFVAAIYVSLIFYEIVLLGTIIK